MEKTEIRGKRIGNCFVLGGPCSAGCGPAPRATSSFSHVSSKKEKRENNEQNVFVRNASDREAALMTFGGSGRSFSAPSNSEKHTCSKKCPNGKKHVF